MTSHAVLAGSVLAGVALWAGVYAALLPRHGLDPAGVPAMSAVTQVSPANHDPPSTSPRRWADLPREAAKHSVALPVDRDGPSAAIPPDVAAPQADHPLRHRRAQIRAATLSEPPLARPRAAQRPRFFARPRFRRIREPIQFSLATRSSS